MTPEKKIQNEILDYLSKLEKQGYPIFHERRQAGGFSYKMGIADIYCVINGRHIEIEVKSKKGHLRPLQLKRKERCIKMNIIYLTIDDINTFIKIINLIFLKKI